MSRRIPYVVYVALLGFGVSMTGHAVMAAEVAQGRALYQQYCSACHGLQGKGDGPAAATMQPKPRNHTDGTYMNTLSDDHLVQVITAGGPAVQKSPLMPPWKGTLTPAQVQDIVVYLRTLAVPPYTP